MGQAEGPQGSVSRSPVTLPACSLSRDHIVPAQFKVTLHKLTNFQICQLRDWGSWDSPDSSSCPRSHPLMWGGQRMWRLGLVVTLPHVCPRLWGRSGPFLVLDTCTGEWVISFCNYCVALDMFTQLWGRLLTGWGEVWDPPAVWKGCVRGRAQTCGFFFFNRFSLSSSLSGLL